MDRPALGATTRRRALSSTSRPRVAGNRNTLAKLLNVPPEKVHLLTHNVGGSFGMKNTSYPEYVCILHAARALGRPVKWTDERSTSFLSDSHGRAQDVHCELALAADGTFLGVRVAAPNTAHTSGSRDAQPQHLQEHRQRSIERRDRVDIKCVVTNTTLMGLRGAGRRKPTFLRVIDRAATNGHRPPHVARQLRKPSKSYAAANGPPMTRRLPAVFQKAVEQAAFAGSRRQARQPKRAQAQRSARRHLTNTAPRARSWQDRVLGRRTVRLITDA